MTNPDDNGTSKNLQETEGLSYGEALEELEELLEELESSDVDVDRLAERVARGVVLVRYCRNRLEVVTEDVDGVVAELISVDTGGPDGQDDQYRDSGRQDGEAESGDD